MKYHLVEYSEEYMIKDEMNNMISRWSSTIVETLADCNEPTSVKSASKLADNRILCTFDQLPTYDYVLQYYPELLI